MQETVEQTLRIEIQRMIDNYSMAAQVRSMFIIEELENLKRILSSPEKPSALYDLQRAYAQRYGQEKLDRLPKRFGEDMIWLASKI